MLEFDEVAHKYKSNGKELTSVTKLINKYTEDFDAGEIIDKMFKKSVTEELYIGPKREYIGMTKEQIKETWDINRISKSAYGTWIHNEAEKIGDFITGKGENSDYITPELNQVRKFFEKEGFEIVEQELRVFSEELGVAGTVDLLLKKDDLYYIYDWKTNSSKDLSEIDNKFGKTLKEPLTNVPYTKFWTYALQMSVYRYILETETRYSFKYRDKFKSSGTEAPSRFKMKFGGSAIVHLIGSVTDMKDNYGKRIYPEMKRATYKIIPTPYLKVEVQSILEDLKDETNTTQTERP